MSYHHLPLFFPLRPGQGRTYQHFDILAINPQIRYNKTNKTNRKSPMQSVWEGVKP